MSSLSKFTHLPHVHRSQKKTFQLMVKQGVDSSTSYASTGTTQNTENYNCDMERMKRFVDIVEEFCDSTGVRKPSEKQLGSGDDSADDPDSIPHMLNALHIHDFGFGDKDQEFMSLLKDNLLELILLTHINVRQTLDR